MKIKTAKFFLLFIICLRFSDLQAQEIVLSGSGNASGDGTVSYSVGQVVYLTKSGLDGVITEGIQQPYEILIPIGIEDKKGITLECLIYPNPANRYVKLEIEKYDINTLSYQLYHMNGSLLLNMKIESDETFIPLEDLAKATYILKITENGKILKTFQIIKK